MATALFGKLSHRRGHKTVRLNSGVRFFMEDSRYVIYFSALFFCTAIAWRFSKSHTVLAKAPISRTRLTLGILFFWLLAVTPVLYVLMSTINGEISLPRRRSSTLHATVNDIYGFWGASIFYFIVYTGLAFASIAYTRDAIQRLRSKT